MSFQKKERKKEEEKNCGKLGLGTMKTSFRFAMRVMCVQAVKLKIWGIYT